MIFASNFARSHTKKSLIFTTNYFETKKITYCQQIPSFAVPHQRTEIAGTRTEAFNVIDIISREKKQSCYENEKSLRTTQVRWNVLQSIKFRKKFKESTGDDSCTLLKGEGVKKLYLKLINLSQSMLSLRKQSMT